MRRVAESDERDELQQCGCARGACAQLQQCCCTHRARSGGATSCSNAAAHAWRTAAAVLLHTPRALWRRDELQHTEEASCGSKRAHTRGARACVRMRAAAVLLLSRAHVSGGET